MQDFVWSDWIVGSRRGGYSVCRFLDPDGQMAKYAANTPRVQFRRRFGRRLLAVVPAQPGCSGSRGPMGCRELDRADQAKLAPWRGQISGRKAYGRRGCELYGDLALAFAGAPMAP